MKLQALLDIAMLSQAEAADLIGVDHRTMRRYVLGQTGYPYCVWFAVQVLCEQINAEKPSLTDLRRLKRDELNLELDKWRDEQSRWPGASRAYARASEHLRAIHEEFVRRHEERHHERATPPKKTQVNGPEKEDVSARHRAAANKAWSDPAFRAGATERALKAAATRRQRKLDQRPG